MAHGVAVAGPSMLLGVVLYGAPSARVPRMLGGELQSLAHTSISFSSGVYGKGAAAAAQGVRGFPISTVSHNNACVMQ